MVKHQISTRVDRHGRQPLHPLAVHPSMHLSDPGGVHNSVSQSLRDMEVKTLFEMVARTYKLPYENLKDEQLKVIDHLLKGQGRTQGGGGRGGLGPPPPLHPNLHRQA